MLKKLRLLSLLALAPVVMQAQSYLADPIAYNPDPFVTSNPIGLAVDDMYSTVIPLPFSFCFYNSSFNHLVVGSNGIVTFDTSVAMGYCPWPISTPLPNAAFAPYSILTPNQDIDPGQGGSISIGTYGVAPYRRFVVSYEAIPMFSCNSLLFSQQVILYETTNIIEVHLKDKPLCANWNNGYAILGMQGSMSDHIEVPGRTVPTQWLASNESWRFSPYNTSCFFLPARDTISGKVYMDMNANCTEDGTDFRVWNAAVIANAGQYYDWTDINGLYSMEVDSGNWAVTHFLPGAFGTLCPSSGVHNVTFNGTGFHSSNNDFADTTNIYCPDLSVSLGSQNFTRCQSELLYLSYCNNGWLTDTNVVVTISLPDSISLDSASVPYANTGLNTYTLSIGTLAPFQCGNAVIYTTMGCDTPGTVYCVGASITGSIADCDTTNNSTRECNALSAAFDPNDKRIAHHNFSQMSWVHNDTIDANARLEYTIRFQNTGNDYAFRVVVRDTLDPRVDLSSVTMGASSHHYQWFINNGELFVEFPDIMLPDSGLDMDGSIGFFRYSARQVPGNLPGDRIRNQAAIYFDDNLPIFTNTTEHVIGEEAVGLNPDQAVEVKLYPNPGHDKVVLEWAADGAGTFTLRNLLGQKMLEIPVQGTRIEIPVSFLQSGLYLWRMEQEGKTVSAGKWVKH